MLNSPKFQFNSQVLVLEELTRHCEKPRSDDKQTLDSALKEFEGMTTERGGITPKSWLQLFAQLEKRFRSVDVCAAEC